MRLLLLSNSTLPGAPFLTWPREHIHTFLGERKRIAFVPFAAVSFSLDTYADLVARAFREEGREVVSLHTVPDPVKALDGCDAVAVGGGNSFQLLRMLYKTGLLRAIADKVKRGMPYVGWSAGSNVACPTIMTTNDMPITEPPSLRAMHLVPFQINPHYTEKTIEGHGGESRDQRIAEYLVLAPRAAVVGLREGSLLRVEGDRMTLVGADMKLFRAGKEAMEVKAGSEMKVTLAGA
jgi:dipeptidase E